jgi:hypothetical protein
MWLWGAIGCAGYLRPGSGVQWGAWAHGARTAEPLGLRVSTQALCRSSCSASQCAWFRDGAGMNIGRHLR